MWARWLRGRERRAGSPCVPLSIVHSGRGEAPNDSRPDATRGAEESARVGEAHGERLGGLIGSRPALLGVIHQRLASDEIPLAIRMILGRMQIAREQ